MKGVNINRKELSQRFDRCTVQETVIIFANTSTLRQTSQVGDVFNHQRHLLCRQVRLSVANATP